MQDKKITRRSCTGYFIFLNTALINWINKKQATIEGSVFGDEFVAMKTGVEALRGIRQKNLCMMGVPLTGPTYVYVDNMSIIYNKSRPESTLKKKSNSICYHAVREAVASGECLTTHLQDRRQLFWHDDQIPIRTEEARQRSLHPLWHLGPRGWARALKRLIVLPDYMTWPRPRRDLFECILFCLPVWHDQDHDGTCLHVFLCLQNQNPLRMKILRVLIKFAHNTYNKRTRNIPSEDKPTR